MWFGGYLQIKTAGPRRMGFLAFCAALPLHLLRTSLQNRFLQATTALVGNAGIPDSASGAFRQIADIAEIDVCEHLRLPGRHDSFHRFLRGTDVNAAWGSYPALNRNIFHSELIVVNNGQISDHLRPRGYVPVCGQSQVTFRVFARAKTRYCSRQLPVFLGQLFRRIRRIGFGQGNLVIAGTARASNQHCGCKRN
jgi:hypothetical protein